MFRINYKDGDKDMEAAIAFTHLETGTICRVLTGPLGTRDEDKTLTSEGRSIRCPGDNPNRRDGRYYSLTRALKPFPPKFRKDVWDLYLKTTTDHRASSLKRILSHFDRDFRDFVMQEYNKRYRTVDSGKK